MTDPTPVTELAFTPGNPSLKSDAVMWTKVPDTFPCKECHDRGGWMPKIDQGDCPQCWGEDTYGEPSFCGECEFCCGC